MTDFWRLDVLPCEILLTIFDYCGVIDLLRISQVCKRFHEIVHMNVTWIKKGKQSLVTNQMSERFRERFVRLYLTFIYFSGFRLF